MTTIIVTIDDAEVGRVKLPNSGDILDMLSNHTVVLELDGDVMRMPSRHGSA